MVHVQEMRCAAAANGDEGGRRAYFDAQFAGQRDVAVIGGAQCGSASVDGIAVGANRLHPASRRVGRLENIDVPTGLLQAKAGGQPTESSSHDRCT
jgi:hypothetical protein